MPEEVFGPCAAAALYHRDQLSDVGGFDERYFCYLEDLAFRLRLTGYRCLYVPEAVVYHVGYAIMGRHSDFAIYHGHRNLVWTFIKNMSGGIFWLYLPQHPLLNFISLVWFSCRGKAGIIFKSKADALKGLPQAWKERRAIQARRKIGAWQLLRVMSKGLFKPYWRSLKQTHRLATAKNRPVPTL
jgi:GT2 family glycosyltransferase